jgi:protocadherin Fat 1/2/3
VFESPEYVVDVSEAAPVGTSVLTVLATDADNGSNARLRYHIESDPRSSTDSNLFYIDSDRGIVLVRQRIDREQSSRLRFIVVATDSGLPTLSASAAVTVNVTDVNDNAPKFDQQSYEASISDRAGRGQFVVAVRASDVDVSDRGRLTYAIVGGNVRQAFAVDPRSGVVSVSNTARRLSDLPSLFLLNVSATDGIFTSFARIRVVVEGSNANAPVFARAVYEVDVAENQAAGLAVASVSATDGDRGTNGEVTYRIASEDADELFDIDPKTGEECIAFYSPSPCLLLT